MFPNNPGSLGDVPTITPMGQCLNHGITKSGDEVRLWGLYFFGACHVDLSEGWAFHRTDTTCASSGLAENALSRCASGGSSNSSHLVEELWGDGGGIRGCFVSCGSYFFGFCLVGERLEHWRLKWEGRKQESCIWPPEIGCSKAVTHYYVILFWPLFTCPSTRQPCAILVQPVASITECQQDFIP